MPSTDFTPNNTPFRPLTAARDGSNFTYESLHNRVPHILTDIVNDFYAAVQGASDAAAVAEGKALTGELSKLKHEMVTDKILTPLEEDGVGDVPAWNRWLELYFSAVTWYSAPFLAWETYMYRRVAAIFKRSQHWSRFDYFAAKKEATFRASMEAVARMCSRVDLLTRDSIVNASSPTRLRVAFAEMLQASLWGNQTDLSMFPNLSSGALEEMQARISSGENSSKVVANDTERIWDIVSRLDGGRVDIVLDNAGFELLQDVLLAHWLVLVGIAKKIVFHTKRVPWYVSDVTNEDFRWLVNVAQTPSLIGAKKLTAADEATLKRLGDQWSEFLANGTWELKDELFWTGPYGFRYLPSEGKDVWDNELTRADLVIFKGDLNYRKLVYDLEWPISTPFVDALGAIATDPRAPAIVALRTSKCDTITGIDSTKAEELFAKQKDWMYSGEYGVIQLSPGRWQSSTQD
ncbi:Hairy/enhancer-of-split with YRPW motif protein 2 [Coemansia thaxteri]|uniref:Sugar phosphate phosphatase n=1 Tax=Coemansia thaxteri TaxID=2663907 RepID=A0A9W8BM44_9FUNG|nr:Hairy/enhancer-of-split with YRPW motif protein 2 [Coemansia thaxteri]KAJ2009059.1 Hairy/enhancer-of-split with YRPW motif protein 2 [Coemansia thaxteri]KAJ2473412.1 Hairy/enhancer-of-split with YRPW motif protein 2 [Coemansia sp. RSA 2322]KAJ2485896.1 Hairy/enhancer-of-split with YRPW motif protein 2 [Coemansia sp. RSA 2320]